MTGPSNPAGERTGTPGTRWERRLASLGETVVEDDDSDQLDPPPAANRATRRAARRKT